MWTLKNKIEDKCKHHIFSQRMANLLIIIEIIFINFLLAAHYYCCQQSVYICSNVQLCTIVLTAAEEGRRVSWKVAELPWILIFYNLQ